MPLCQTCDQKQQVVCHFTLSTAHFSTTMSLIPMQYVTKASSAVRAALKEPAKTKAMAQETFSYNRATWSEGTMGAKTLVDGLKAVGK